jgi:hypothetical protein
MLPGCHIYNIFIIRECYGCVAILFHCNNHDAGKVMDKPSPSALPGVA